MEMLRGIVFYTKEMNFVVLYSKTNGMWFLWTVFNEKYDVFCFKIFYFSEYGFEWNNFNTDLFKINWTDVANT